MPSNDAAIDFIDEMIRHAVKKTHFPVARLLDIAREAITDENESEMAWRLAELKGDQAKPLIEKRSGEPLTTEQVAEVLHVSDETVRTRVRQNQLIAYPAIRGKGLRFPMWQFDGEVRQRFTSAIAPFNWVPQVIEAYGHNGWGLLDFLTVPRTHLNGLSYHALLRSEDGPAQVITAARRANRD